MRRSRTCLASLLVLAACAGRGPDARAPDAAAERADVTAEERAETGALLHDLRALWLDRDTVPAPQVSYEPQTQSAGGVMLTVAPGLPEEQPWNAWPDGTARLFNDAIGYLWRVRLTSDRPVRWLPERTRLAVNVTERTYVPASSADDLLLHLLRGAVVETRFGHPPDLSLRARSADPFRRAYLDTEAAVGERERVVVFPAPTRDVQTVALELTLGLWVDGEGLREHRFLFE